MYLVIFLIEKTHKIDNFITKKIFLEPIILNYVLYLSEYWKFLKCTFSQ